MPHKIVMSSFSDTVWGSCSHHFAFGSMLNSLQMFQCRHDTVLLCLCEHSAWPGSGHPATIEPIIVLEFNTYPAHWFCAIFEDFVPVVVGLDGLVLGSSDQTLRFRLQPSCFETLVCRLLANIFFIYFWGYCPYICFSSQFCLIWS